ncbi:universal stress protein [Nocardia jejuensis]|uniref:universal stress protein n=1 Tax=Nocardia jejuensis TaxID=328049 RepID=UPI00082C00A0|nr:universal stress protein [Nocardia jejuensis]
MTRNEGENPHALASAPVIVGIDDSEAAQHAVRWAAETACARGRELLIVHGTNLKTIQGLLGSYAAVEPEVTQSVQGFGEELVAAAARAAREVDPELRVRTEVSSAHPARLLIDSSAEAHLLVLGGPDERRGFNKLGSILIAVSSGSRGAVVVVRDGEREAPRTGPVVVGVDGSPTSEAAIEAAFAEASQRVAPLVAVHTWSDQYLSQFSGLVDTSIEADQLAVAEQSLLVERLAGWQEKYPDVVVTREVYLSSPADHLQTWSESAQLLVVGSRGRGGFTGMLLGSTSNALVQRAHCPVMVVHPD